MLFDKMSSTMKSKCCHRFTNILLLSIIWTMLFTETMARPNLDALFINKPNDLQQQQQQQQQQKQQQQQQDIFLDEMITSTNSDKLFNKLRKYHRNQPNYITKWPGLRELITNFDYADNSSQEDSNEFWNSKFFERLRQLASLKTESYDSDDNMRDDSSDKSSSNQLTFKEHNTKKNVQYMSPCHFKICNMGRKRNARFLTSN
ncbi:hypothetical protein DOY81_002892 [Sarcophaga bullata]|nr:hypothetical protein DOY81_002892 [Sarcophaga bullata]